jgi:hypothetical protein
MNSYEVNRLLEEARKLAPQQLSYSTELKTVSVLVERLEYEHKVYSNHRYEKGVAPDVLKMPPSHAKEHWAKGQIEVFRGGACDVFTIHGLKAFRPWTTGPDEPVRDGYEATWVRCRLTKFVSIIPGLDPRELLGVDFCLQWHFLRSIGQISLEGENPNSIEIAVPQAVPEAART